MKKQKFAKIPTLKKYREIFLLNRDGADSTRYNDKKVFDLLLDNFGNGFYIYNITKGDVLGFKAFLQIKYNSRSVNKYLSIFGMIYNQYWETYSKEIYKIDPSLFITKGNPFKRVMFSKRELKPVNGHLHLSQNNFNKLCSTIRMLNIEDPEQLSDIVSLAYYLGLRRSEILNIRIQDIKQDRVIINGYKTGDIREVPLFDGSKNILSRRKLIANKNGYLFTYSYSTMYKHLKQAVIKSRLDKEIAFHTLRRSFVTNLIRKNIPAKIVSQFAGHTSFKMTEDHYYIKSDNFNEYLQGV